MPLRNYVNSAPSRVLTDAVDDVDTVLTVVDTTGFPTRYPFALTLARQTGSEEIVYCTASDGTTFTVTRGQQGTSGVSHGIGTLVEHTSTALDYREAGIVQITSAERTAIQGDSIDDWMGRTIFNTTTRELEVSNGADLFAPVMPVGAILPYGGASAPVGWFLCDGTAKSQASFPELFAIIGLAYGDPGGGNFNLPDLRQRFPLGKAAAGTGSTLGETGGAIDHVHTGPSHTHTGPSHTHTGPSHTHTMSTHTHTGPSHTHTGPSHAHTMNGHSHTGPSHTHSFSDSFTTGIEPQAAKEFATGTFFGADDNHTHSGSVSGTTGAGGTGSTSNVDPGDTNAGGTGATGAGGTGSTGATNPGDTAASGTAATGASGTGATGAEGTGNTGTANAPFQVVNYIIFAGISGG